MESSPFSDKTPDGILLCQAAAHGTDLEAIHQAVFYRRGDIATGVFSRDSPWHIEGARSRPEYDPEKAKFLLKKAKAVGVMIDLMADTSWPYRQQTGDPVLKSAFYRSEARLRILRCETHRSLVSRRPCNPATT